MKGYYAWGPIQGSGTLSYRISARYNNVDLDVFLFDEANARRYFEDAGRDEPFGAGRQAGYLPVAACLEDRNCVDDVVLDPTVKYYLVVDHTDIGPTKQRDEDGREDYEEVRFRYKIWGIDEVSVAEGGESIISRPSAVIDGETSVLPGSGNIGFVRGSASSVAPGLAFATIISLVALLVQRA